MKTEENYRIMIEEWTEQVEVFEAPIKHTNYIVQQRYIRYNWFDHNILGIKDKWLTQSVHANFDEAILHMGNLHNRENPTIKYYHKSTLL